VNVKKTVSIALISTSLVLGLAASGNAAIESVGDPGRFWSVPNNAENGQVIMQFLDSFPGEIGSLLVSNQGYERYPENDPTCSNLQDSKCSSGNIRYQAVVPFCMGPTDVNCTEDVGVVDETGKKTSAVFNRYFPTTAQNQFEGNASYKLPNGGAGSIFSIPSAAHDGGDSYYLSVLMSGGGQNLNSIRMADFSVQLSPIKLEPVSILGSSDTGWGILRAGENGNLRDKDVWVNAGPGFTGDTYCIASSYK